MMACAWLSIFSTTPPPRIWIALHAPLTSLALLFFGCGTLSRHSVFRRRFDVLYSFLTCPKAS